MRSRDASATDKPSVLLSRVTPHALLSRCRGCRLLDPRPRASPCFALSRKAPTRASLGQVTAHQFLQLHFRRSDTLSSFRFSLLRAPRKEPEAALVLAVPVREPRPSPFEEGLRMPRAATALPTSASWRCKPPRSMDSGSYRPTLTPLAGDALTRPPLAVMVVWTTALDCTGRVALSEGPLL